MSYIYIYILLIIFNYILNKKGYLDYNNYKGKSYTVTYDSRAVMINGERTNFLAGSIHYPRFGEGEWDEILRRAKEDNLNLVQIYVFWNYHEEYEGKYRWDGNANLTKFIELAGNNGLFVNMRIGPYVCAEWNFGGFPAWLYMKEGCELRGDNTVFKNEMTKFTKLIIEQTRHLFNDKGGPIIMSQIENELWGPSQGYMDYLYTLVNEVNREYKIQIPWVMCNGETTNNTINACNGNDCAGWLESHGQSGRIQIDHPAIWTENEGWYTNWGDYYPDFGGHGASWSCRTATDLAYTVARYYARGGSYMNYYMYNGGNNFGIWSGSSTTTMYADSVNFHSDMTKNEPIYSHMHKLHIVISDISEILVNDKTQLYNSIPLPWWDGEWKQGNQQRAFVYSYNGNSVAFVESDAPVNVLTKYDGIEYFLLPWSILIVDNKSKKVLYNSSNVENTGLDRVYTPVSTQLKLKIYKEQTISNKLDKIKDVDISKTQLPVIQLKYTGGHSEYMIYEINLELSSLNCDIQLGGKKGGSYVFYLNGKYSGEVSNVEHASGNIDFGYKLNNQIGSNRLTIINEAFGWTNLLWSSMGMDADHGIRSLSVCGIKYDYSDFTVRPYLEGEILKLYTEQGSKSVTWSDYSTTINTGGVWYKTEFPTPKLTEDQYVAIDLLGMCRGHVYVNGYDLGRYWLILGWQQETPTQRYYHVPKDWLYYDGKQNSLVLVDICNPINPTSIGIDIVEIKKI